MLEHHSNNVPWQFVAEATGAKLVAAPINDRGEIILEEFGIVVRTIIPGCPKRVTMHVQGGP